MFSRMARKTLPALLTIILLLSIIPAVQAQDLPLLTLDECIQKGLKHDPSIVQSEAALKRSSNSLLSAYGNFLPRISVGLDYNWSSRPTVAEYREIEQPDGSIIQVPIYVNDSYSSGLSINQTIFQGFSRYFSWRSARNGKMSSEKSLDAQVLQTVYNLKTSYFNVLKTMKLSDVQKKAMERSEEQLRIIETRYDLGSAALTDVLKAKVSYGEAKLALISAENAYKVAMATLNHLMGQEIDRQYRVDTTVSLKEVDYTLDETIETAMGSNPTLKSLKYNMEASKNSVRSAWGGYLPSLTFSYSTSYYQRDKLHFSRIFSDNHSYRYGFNLSLNIFDRFLTHRQISDAKATHNTNKFNYYNYVNGLKLDVTNAYLELDKARLSLEVAGDKLVSAREDYKLAQERYTLGAATILDLLDAEVSLKAAESDVIESEYSLNLAIAELEKVMGMNSY